MIANGANVAIEYTLKLDDGSTVSSNVGQEPLSLTIGDNQVLPALETALVGLKQGDSKQLTFAPADGYGATNPEAFVEVGLDQVPEGAGEAGTFLVSKDKEGNERHVRVHEVHDDKIVIDYNHPLAGETLHFDVTVVTVE